MLGRLVEPAVETAERRVAGDPRLVENLAWGEPRTGHPEGSIAAHVEDLLEKLEAAVQRADALCEEMRLLTLASSADLRALRQWMTEEIVQQSRHGAAPVAITSSS